MNPADVPLAAVLAVFAALVALVLMVEHLIRHLWRSRASRRWWRRHGINDPPEDA